MIHGATIRRPSAIRTAAETTTIPVSHTHAGTATARSLTAAAALMGPTSLGRRLERGDVSVRGAAEIVLLADVLEGPRAQLLVTPRHELEGRLERRHLVLVDRDLERDVVGQLGE